MLCSEGIWFFAVVQVLLGWKERVKRRGGRKGLRDGRKERVKRREEGKVKRRGERKGLRDGEEGKG